MEWLWKNYAERKKKKIGLLNLQTLPDVCQNKDLSKLENKKKNLKRHGGF